MRIGQLLRIIVHFVCFELDGFVTDIVHGIIILFTGMHSLFTEYCINMFMYQRSAISMENNNRPVKYLAIEYKPTNDHTNDPTNKPTTKPTNQPTTKPANKPVGAFQMYVTLCVVYGKNTRIGCSLVVCDIQNRFVKWAEKCSMTFSVQCSTSIKSIKDRISTRLNLSFDSTLWLHYNGKILQDECVLSDYNIVKENTLHLLVRLDGAGRKNKLSNEKVNGFVSMDAVLCVIVAECMTLMS